MDELRCYCGELILKSYDDHRIKLRSAVLVFFEDGIAKAVCKRCKVEHEVPVVLDQELAKSLHEKKENRRLIIRKSYSPEIVVRKKSG